jgi:hypothetical protein
MSVAPESTEYDKLQDQEIKKLKDKVFGGTNPEPDDCGPDPDPNHEHIKEGGWGGDMSSPMLWQSVPMKEPPEKWKVMDKEGINIAHNFETEEDADIWIKYHQCIQEVGDVDPEPVPPKPEPGPIPTSLGPYATRGNPMQSTQRGPTTRHYASGKPDDQTIEKNVKNITFDNYQFIVDVTMNEMEHDDNISTKLGGTHMGSGWFDHSVSIYSGATGLGLEPKHPSTDLFVIKGPKIGDIRNKPIRVAATYFKKTNKTELWTDFDGSGWIKQVEGKDVGDFNPKSKINEAQLRIDGFKNVPTIRSAIVLEIAAEEP